MDYLTEIDQSLLQGSWNRLHGREMDFTTLFYDELFKEYPSYLDMFSTDIGKQKLKFIEMINIIINGIMYLEELLPTIKLLGKKHDKLGVQAKDYDNVIDIFIKALAKFSNDISREEITQWSRALNTLKAHMLDFND